ncbi:Alanine--glyoxylate aminotransferase 2-like protein [Leptotrombidium deliense]|uniref:Alanine--glyoxylate aminotransferase 2, mitochondrial n=1 Tax=Leptotrombidium deliense TaxID=299467 RepID=A0A443SGX1_9ACAR|nr:Alanine--glyoxylate aminotransferase 2-like protein [Leptotrombidium deliense]
MYVSKCTNKIKAYYGIFRYTQRRLVSSEHTPQLPQCDFKPLQFKSQLKSTSLDSIKRNVNACFAQMYSDPMVISQGHMQYVWDTSGKRYLDMFGGIVTVSVGHCHPTLVEALSKQASKLWHVSRAHVYEEIYDYSAKLAQRLPSSLSTIFLCNSGSEANDLALVLARLYTQSFDFIALRNAYHGCSSAAMGLTAIGTWKYNFPNGFGIHHTLNPDPYRGKYGGKACRDSMFQVNRECDCKVNECVACDSYIADLEDVLNTSCSQKKIAGFIAESIQGIGGVVQYPKNYLKRAAELIRKRGGVFISDEVQTGFGRTGTHFWGFQNHDVTPDIVTMAKGIGNGFPLAAVATTAEIASAMNEALYFNTYAGNPLASAVGSKVLDIIDEEHLQENSRILGSRFSIGLNGLMNQFDNVIGDVRGKGLMIGVELVSDKVKKTPLSKAAVGAILDDCKEMGLIIGKGGAFGNVLRIKPPMCINDADIKFAIEVLEKCFENHNRREKI